MTISANHIDFIRKLRILLILLALIGVGVPIYIFSYHSSTNRSEDTSSPQSPSQRLEIRGFSYNGIVEGKKVISIKADRFLIEKKKLGFLRFNLMNVARFANTQIRIYGIEQLADINTAESNENPQQRLSAEKTSSNTAVMQKNPQPKLSFKKAFSKEALQAFPIKQISSVTMEPIYIEVLGTDTVVTRISASSADLRLAKQYILLKGNVRVTSGDNVLTADRLVLLPEMALLKTGGQFVLKTPLQEFEGRQLTTDIFLKPMSS